MRHRKNTTFINSENSDKSDDGILSFSGVTRWPKHNISFVKSIQAQRKSNLEVTMNNISKLLEKVPNNGYGVTNIQKYGRAYRRTKELFILLIEEISEIFIPEEPEQCYSFLKRKS